VSKYITFIQRDIQDGPYAFVNEPFQKLNPINQYPNTLNHPKYILNEQAKNLLFILLLKMAAQNKSPAVRAFVNRLNQELIENKIIQINISASLRGNQFGGSGLS